MKPTFWNQMALLLRGKKLAVRRCSNCRDIGHTRRNCPNVKPGTVPALASTARPDRSFAFIRAVSGMKWVIDGAATEGQARRLLTIADEFDRLATAARSKASSILVPDEPDAPEVVTRPMFQLAKEHTSDHAVDKSIGWCPMCGKQVQEPEPEPAEKE